MTKEYDVIIIGGGITGAGVARDCALRGLRTMLVEKNDFATGATGRNHGLLHSGARYAVKDAESAKECIIENKIIKKIAPECVEDFGGLFITLPEDIDAGYGLDYQQKFIEACHAAGIEAKRIDPKEALALEPSVNPSLIGAVRVPDASVDPFRLCISNVYDAKLHGADVLQSTEFVDFVKEGDSIVGVKLRESGSKDIKEYRASVTVNAAGVWGQTLVEKAGAKITMYPAKGTLLVFGHRVNNVVINRCRKSADGDILVPGGTVTVLGTTSTKVPLEECDSLIPTHEEVLHLLDEGCSLCPTLASTRILRAYSGARPLVAEDSDPTGRNISRGIVCLDHESRDGIRGFITITGGKLTDYRMMGELATNMVCKKLGITVACSTAEKVLPSIGNFAITKQGPFVCECERVSAEDIKHAVDELGARSLADVRRRTRIGMGTCQGTFCIHKASKALAECLETPQEAENIAFDYLSERWKGMTRTGWGDTIREMEFMQKVYKEGLPYSYDTI